jgi:hypothetical protein
MERSEIREVRWLFKCLFPDYASSIRATALAGWAKEQDDVPNSYFDE